MRYGFIKLRNDDNSTLYMEPRNFERYQNYDVFKNHAESLVVFENIHIGIFPLIFPLKEIIEFNSDAVVKEIIPLSDISFKFNTISGVAKLLDCDNAFTL